MPNTDGVTTIRLSDKFVAASVAAVKHEVAMTAVCHAPCAIFLAKRHAAGRNIPQISTLVDID